ncbi:MAG: cytochrome P450 [Pseudonocardiales bacterium]|nr:cytochrome P450 [Pseudonocardiales bacterium]
MNRNELRFAFQTLPFLDSHEGDPTGVLELRARPTPRLLVWHPEGIDWIFRADRQLYHIPSRTLNPLLGRKSLLGAEGLRHSAYRRVLGPSLRGHQLQVCHNIISHTVHAAIDVLAPGAVISLIEWTRKITLCIISQIVLGRAENLLLELFSARVDSVLGSRSRTLAHRYLYAHALSISARWPFSRGRRELDETLLRNAKNTATTQPPALAALLLAGDGPLGVLDDEELRDQIMSLLFAGHETTASTTAWILYWLGCDDRVRRDVIAELTITSNDGSDPAQVPLLHAVTQEALRLSPPAIIAGKRMLTAAGELLGKPLPAGAILTPCMYLAHHQPDQFPNPRRFDPNRFLGNRVPRQYYFPFGGGTRHCLGSELAMLEIRMITAAVLRRCRLHCVNPEAGIPELRGPAMTLARGLRMSITPHRMVPRNMPP